MNTDKSLVRSNLGAHATPFVVCVQLSLFFHLTYCKLSLASSGTNQTSSELCQIRALLLNLPSVQTTAQAVPRSYTNYMESRVEVHYMITRETR